MVRRAVTAVLAAALLFAPTVASATNHKTTASAPCGGTATQEPARTSAARKPTRQVTGTPERSVMSRQKVAVTRVQA
jgi:hypothetical protein